MIIIITIIIIVIILIINIKLKLKLKIEKAKIVSSNYKSMHIYCKKCKKHRSNTFPKKLVLISRNKIKGKSRCAICLTKRTIVDEIEGDLEIGLEISLESFTD